MSGRTFWSANVLPAPVKTTCCAFAPRDHFCTIAVSAGLVDCQWTMSACFLLVTTTALRTGGSASIMRVFVVTVVVPPDPVAEHVRVVPPVGPGTTCAGSQPEVD